MADYHFELFDPSPSAASGALEAGGMGGNGEPWFRIQQAAPSAPPAAPPPERADVVPPAQPKAWPAPRPARIEPDRLVLDAVSAIAALDDSSRVPTPESSILPVHRVRLMVMPRFDTVARPIPAFQAARFRAPARAGAPVSAAAITRQEARQIAVIDEMPRRRRSTQMMMAVLAVAAIVLAVCVVAQAVT